MNVAGNVTGISQEISDVERPDDLAGVQQLVARARRDKTPLYPVSTGLNWGYGSVSPVCAGATLVDLSGMRRILNESEISVTNPVAVIEPGVTQQQLHAFLSKRCPSLTFNVTGSALDTSIIGNSLDRGVGYMGPRREDLFGLEVVTGAGTVLQTGFRRLGEASPLAHCHPYGLGPMLDGLFFQGNFGIVTSACFKLLPRPACQVGISLALSDASLLAQFIDVLAQLKRERVMGSVTHIANKARTRASLAYGVARYLEEKCGVGAAALGREGERVLNIVAPDEWTSLGGISGTKRQVDAAVAEVRARVGGLARVMEIDDAKLSLGYNILHWFRAFPWARANAAAIAAVRPLNGLATGVPTDVAIANLLWRFGRSDLLARELDNTNCGLMFVSPALPMDGRFAADVVQGMTAIARDHQLELYATINIETESSMVAVTNLLFDRSDAKAMERAKRCADALHAFIKARGLEVYRARADMMADVVDPSSDYWKMVRQLKLALDPDNIIAPGRYNIPE